MYYSRTLTTEEALYVSRAQQRIAELGVIIAEESSRNDVDDYNVELITELEYSINVLKSTFLDWTPDEVRGMMDYYTLKGGLVSFAFRSIAFNPTHTVEGSSTWATVPQLQEVETASSNYDEYLLNLIQQEVTSRIDGDTFLLNLINNFSGGTLVEDLTAEIDIGGILEGTTFLAGTTLEVILTQLLAEKAVASNFSFNSYTGVAEVGVNFSITEFTWDMEGSPVNLTLKDSKGLLVDVPVAGTSHSVNLGYDWSIPETLTWTLSADNMKDVVITVDRIYPSYYGKEATADDSTVNVTEAKVLLGEKTLSKTVESITLNVDTATTEQGFIAVPKDQTDGDYSKWFVDNTNFSNIESQEFITPPVDLLVNGVTYQIYKWGYRSPLTNNLTLRK